METTVHSPFIGSLPDPEAESTKSRLATVVRIEWMLLTLRYLCFFSVVVCYALGITPDYLPNLWLVMAATVAHNVYAHAVLYAERHRIFLSPLNFLLNLVSISLAVGMTGGEESPISLAYGLLVIGYCAYSPQKYGPFQVALLCSVAYTFTVIIRWLLLGVNLAYPPIALQFFAILLFGWLASTLNERLHQTRYEYRRQAQMLASSEAMLRTILDSMPHPIVVYEENGFISHTNDRAAEFFEMDKSQLVGQRFRRFFFDDGTLANKLSNLRAHGEYRGEFLINTAEGNERNAEVLVRSFLRDEKRFFVSMFHDISERKQLQEASRVAHLQLEELNREFQQVNELRETTLTLISQRLQSPLSAVLGFVELLLDDELGVLNEEQRSALQACRRSVLHIFDIAESPFSS